MPIQTLILYELAVFDNKNSINKNAHKNNITTGVPDFSYLPENAVYPQVLI